MVVPVATITAATTSQMSMRKKRKENNMDNKITINLSGASDNVKEWFKQMLEDEITDIKETIENEELWIKGARDEEEAEAFEANKKEHEEYLEYLEDALKQLRTFWN